MKTLFIVSPTVENAARETLRDALAPSQGELYDIQPEDVISEVVARRVNEEGIGRVAAVGGDGTVSAVAQGLRGTDIPLAVIPAGTGNLVARDRGIPEDIAKAAALIAGPHRLRQIDTLLINGHTYLLNAGVGVNAATADRTPRLGKNLFGRTAYVGTAVLEVLQAKPQRLEIEVDGEAGVYEATDVLISNCGGLARVIHPNGPDIQMDDGQVDVCIVCMKHPLEYPLYYLGKTLFPDHETRIVHDLPARRTVTIRSETPVAVQADGDIIGTTPVTITVRPNACSVIVPPAP
jgi:diacylglycerol kinase family enzyme